MAKQIEINLTNLADTEQVILRKTKIDAIRFVSGFLCGGWMGNSVKPEVCQIKHNKDELIVQMHLYADNYCKGVQLRLKQKGDDICGKIEWAKGTKRRAERNERIEKILQSDWNDTSDADMANLDTNIPIGKKGYGVEKIIVEIEPQEEVLKEEAKKQEAKPEVSKETGTKTEKVKCPKCGTESTGNFCPECGTPLVKAAEAPLQEQKREKVVSSPTESMAQPIATNKKETLLPGNTLHTQLEKKIKEVKQVPVHLEERYSQRFMEEELSNGLSFDNPKRLYDLDADSFNLKNELFTAIEKAASEIDGYSSETKAKKRAARNFGQIVENPKIQKGKFLFAECVEERIIRKVNPMEQVVGQDCERLKKTSSCESPYDIPYDEKSDGNRIFNYEIREDGAHEKCHVCNGEKIESCPKCDGSGREQYIDSYFASGEPKYKTGQCSRCYGKGFITCRHCDGSGLEFKGYGTYANVRSYKEKRFYNFASLGISPWGYANNNDERFGECIDFDHSMFHNPEFEFKNKNNKIIVQYNEHQRILDKRDELKNKVLAEIGYEYGSMYELLQERIEGKLVKNLLWENKNNDDATRYGIKFSEGKLSKKYLSFDIYDIYKINYTAGGKKYDMTIIVNPENGKALVYFSALPQMGVFGGIK